MAAPIRIPHWITLTVHAQYAGQELANVFSYQTETDIGDPTACDAMASAFWTQIGAQYTAMCPGLINFSHVICRTLYPQPDNFEGTYFIPQPHPGTFAGDTLPANVCGVISERTGAVGRSFRGRAYPFPTGETLQSGDIFLGGYIVDMADLAALLYSFAGIVGHGADWSVASRKLFLLIRITEFLTNAYIRSQRDRLPGERRHRRRHTTS